MKLQAQKFPRILVVTKNVMYGLDVRIANSPLHFPPERGKGAEVWVYHYLTRNSMAGEYEPVSGLAVRKDTGLRLQGFDLIVVYLTAQGVLRLGAKPAAFPLREEDLAKLPAEKLVYVTSDEPLHYMPLLERVGHTQARVVPSEAGGGETMLALFNEAHATGSISL